MTVHPGTLMSKTEFLDWVVRQPGRYELVEGRPVMMVGATLRHQRICESLRAVLRAALPRRDYDITIETFAVDVADGIRFPDVQVFKRTADASRRVSTEPILIIEVLSPSSLADDFRAKADAYLTLPSLDAYVIAASDEARLRVWRRRDGVFAAEPDMLVGADRLELPSLNVALEVATIYEDVF
jgi:Uma2 family endonuclease